MHILTSVVLIISALAFLTYGLLGVLRDLLERSPYESPELEEPSLAPARILPSPARRPAASQWTCNAGRQLS